LPGYHTPITEIVFSPQGTRLAIITNNEMAIWDLAMDNQIFFSLPITEGPVYWFDEQTLGTNTGIWDVLSGQQVLDLKNKVVGYAPDQSHLLTVDSSETILTLWSLKREF
jgi:WD40 repeat protein